MDAQEINQELLTALIELCRYANGQLNKNPYGIPQYKRALIAICHATGKPTAPNSAWMDAIDTTYGPRL